MLLHIRIKYEYENRFFCNKANDVIAIARLTNRCRRHTFDIVQVMKTRHILKCE